MTRHSRELGLLGLLGLLAAPLGVAASSAPGVVQLDIQRRHNDGTPVRRRGTIVETLENDRRQGAYMADVEIGTPAQKVTLQLDTGSSDTWVVYTGSSICKSGGCLDGSYDPKVSSTFFDLAKDTFSIGYVDKTSASGDHFNDVFTIGSATLHNLTMGIGLDTDIPYGLIGVGYPANEAGVASGVIQAYPNLPVQMATEGHVNTVAYSMWLNDPDASTGNLLFGGVDTAKYSGPLTRLKLYPTRQEKVITDFAVALTSVSAVSKSGTDNLGSSSFPVPVVLDAGSTLSFLPSDLVRQIHKEADVTVIDGTAVVPCSYVNAGGYLSFGFGGPGGAVVNVSMGELVLGLAGQYTAGPHKGQNGCMFGINDALDSDIYLLGDSFLRSAYVVYDLMNDQVAVAQAKFNVTEATIIAFPSLSADIPMATPAPNEKSGLTQGIVTATPTAFAAAAGFTAASAASGFGMGREAGGAFGKAALAMVVSLGAGFVGFLV